MDKSVHVDLRRLSCRRLDNFFFVLLLQEWYALPQALSTNRLIIDFMGVWEQVDTSKNGFPASMSSLGPGET